MASDTTRIITTYLDVERCREVTATNATQTNTFSVFRDTHAIFRATLRQADGTTPFVVDPAATFAFYLNDSWLPADEASRDSLVQSDNSQFNIAADWASLSLATGKICWRLDLTGDALAAALSPSTGSLESLTGHAELWYTAPGANPTVLAQWKMTMANIVGGVGIGGALVYTSIIAWDGDDVILKNSSGAVVARFQPA